MEKSIKFKAVVDFAEPRVMTRVVQNREVPVCRCGLTFASLKEVADDGTEKEVEKFEVVSKGAITNGDGIVISWRELLKSLKKNKTARRIGIETAQNPQSYTIAQGILCDVIIGEEITFTRDYYKKGEKNPVTGETITDPFFIKTSNLDIRGNEMSVAELSEVVASLKEDRDANGMKLPTAQPLQFMNR